MRLNARLAVVGLIGLLTFAACAAPAAQPRAAQPPAATSQSVAVAPATGPSPVATRPALLPTEKTRLVFGGAVTPPSMVHLPPYVAKAMGFFDEVGLDVEIISFEGGVGALRGGIAGGLDVVATSSDPLFAAIQQGAPVKAIGTYAPKLSVVITSAPDIRTPRDLRGRRVGIQEVGGFNEVMTRLLLQTAGMTPDDVQYINVSTANRVPSLVQGQVDATTLHIDQYYAATSQKSDLVNLAKMWEVAPDWWYSAFVVTEDNIRNKREALIAFMTAVIKAQRFMYMNPEETKRIAVEETRRQPGEVDRAYEDLTRAGIWSVNDGMPRNLILATVDKEAEVGIVRPDSKPTYEQIVERSIVEEAIRRNGGAWSGDPRWY